MQNSKKLIFLSGIVALLVSLSTIGIFQFLSKDDNKRVTIEHVNKIPASNVLYTENEDGEIVPLDFTEIAAKVVDAVVHIKSTQNNARDEQAFEGEQMPIPDEFKEFFGDQFFFFREGPDGQNPRSRSPQPSVGTGSGVIIDEGGYIVTNNHVIADADDIEVSLHDNRTYKASVIGTDPTTDLAVIKIDESGLTKLPLLDSDEVKVGEWVLAVGNPFSLNSTVTAGIVSAKGRSINILREQFAIESFIQTDAAINPGNSGGALVDLSGGLVGINTAIATRTGAYNGYGFAVPSNIVRKVVEDLLEFGTVQRGVLGIVIRSVDGNFAKEKGLDLTNGVYVDSLLANSAAGEAGIQAGDVIIEINGIKVTTSPELQEIVGRQRPGDDVSIKLNREGQIRDYTVTLKSRAGDTQLITKRDKTIFNMLGADLQTVDQEEAEKLGIKGGVKVIKLYPGTLRQQTQIQEGFIITAVDDEPIVDAESLSEKLKKKEGGVMLEGVYENSSKKYYYAFGL